jgi:copper transport protein
VHGFSRISTPAIVITVVSGLIQLYRLDGGELFKTGHGRVLLLKTIAVAAMIFVGLTARQVARARLARASELNVRVADRMRRAFGTEAAIGLVVLMLTGWMMSFTPGKVDSGDSGGGGDWAVERQFVDQNAGLEAELFVRPARAGVNNDVRIEVSSPDEGISDFHVVFTSPDGQTIIDQPVAITGAQVAQTAGDGGGIPFNVGGNWTVEITASTPNGPASSSGAITILNADGSQPSGIDVPALPATTTVVPDGPRLTDPPPSSAPGSTDG